MDAGLLDVLHDRGDVGLAAVAERVDVDLDRVLHEAVDEDGAVELLLERPAHVVRAVADPHRAPAEHVRRPHDDGIADLLGALKGLVGGARGAIGRLRLSPR